MYTRQMEVAAAEQQSGEPEVESSFADELVYRAQADEPPILGLPGGAPIGQTADGTADVLAQLGVNVIRVQFGARDDV